MKNIMDTLSERGFLRQVVFEDELRKLLETQSVTFYIGFDPTADSLHVGHFVQLMAMRHMQLAGHKPIVLIGGGTAMIGDPSGRTDMRSMMTDGTIKRNVEAFRAQMAKFISFEGDNAAIIVDNADWLLPLNYLGFMRDIGAHFSVNRMLTAECFRSRLEKGLTFLEFSYMLMQAYDFLVLHNKYDCKLQMGGDDQWSNILAGADLIRRKEQKEAYAMTFALLTTSEGTKMGKTAKGALWLDGQKTPPYDFFQYFRNVADPDVQSCLNLLTFLPVEQIKQLTSEGKNINTAKEVLAFEVTKLVHGEEEASRALTQARAAFSGDSENMPALELSGIANITELLVAAKLAPSNGAARRLIEGGGVKIDEEKVSDPMLSLEGRSEFVLHKGKKTHLKITLK